uniref:DNA ligase ATP-dependent N-terminal domain-containing protein n=1 Tax=Rhizophora mucronata TaxID=61149 RepID=A0A2P2K9R1_RHIMU
MHTLSPRLRPCVSLRLITRSHRFSLFSKSSPYLVFLSPSKFTTMSSRRSAFDALMSTARAAAAAKRKPAPSQSISPKKPKTPDPLVSAAKTLADSVESPLCIGTRGLSTGNNVQNPTEKAPPANMNAEKGEFGIGISKKMRNENRIVELKKKIGLLKNKSADFDPKGMACWEKQERVPFIFLCLAMDMIANEGGRIVITDIVCNMLRTVMDTTPDDLLAVVYLLANKVAPAHEGVELGIGEASIIKALAEAFGRTEKEVKKQAKDKGDLGLVAKESRLSQSMMRMPDALTITKVFNTFRLIAKESGKDSQDKKKNHIKALLVAAIDCEPQYLIRLLQVVI